MPILNRIGLVVAKKWIAGTTIEEAIRASRVLNALGEKVILNQLGEEFSDAKKVEDSVSRCRDLILAISKSGIRGSVSVKPTQLGLTMGYKKFNQNYIGIVAFAKKYGVFVWTDMEGYKTVGSTIRSYLAAQKRYGNVGICIQSKLRRSMSDIKTISRRGGMIRLVKGAYGNQGPVSYGSKEEINANYIRCMEYLFKHSKGFTIATHDDKMIDLAHDCEKKYRKKATFAMLRGIRPSLARKLAAEGEDMQIYVPFGEEWIDYSMRRLKEFGNSILILRSIFQG